MTEPLETELYLSSEKDELFEKGPWPKPFAFNAEVVKVFDNMVCRSVPLYREVVAGAVHWTRAYYQPKTRIIDIGCSTGTFLELLGRFLKQPAILVGIDNSPDMLNKAKEKLAEQKIKKTQDRHEGWDFSVSINPSESSNQTIQNYLPDIICFTIAD